MKDYVFAIFALSFAGALVITGCEAVTLLDTNPKLAIGKLIAVCVLSAVGLLVANIAEQRRPKE